MEARPLVSLLYTTARPNLIPEVLMRWLTGAQRVEALVVTDGQAYQGHDQWTDPTREISLVSLANQGRPDAVSGWNTAAGVARGDVMVQVSDDLHPPERWDDHLRARLDVERPQVLAVNDALKNDRLIRHAILTRRYFQQLGYLFHPSYASMYSDHEFTDVAYARQAVVEARDLRFEHRHPRLGPGGLAPVGAGRHLLDRVGRVHESPSRYRHGRANYIYRRARGFPPDPTVALSRSLRHLPRVWFYFYLR